MFYGTFDKKNINLTTFGGKKLKPLMDLNTNNVYILRKCFYLQ